MKNYYEILEVSSNASPEVIERAYKVLAKKYHPDMWPKDKNFFAENKFKELTEAYTVLSNVDSRRNYDIQIGIIPSLNDKYNDLYLEHEQLKKDFNTLKSHDTSQNLSNKYSVNAGRQEVSTSSFVKKYLFCITNTISNEFQKSSEERSKDFKALFLTIIIISGLIYILWKFPFLKNIIFP